MEGAFEVISGIDLLISTDQLPEEKVCVIFLTDQTTKAVILSARTGAKIKESQLMSRSSNS